MTTMHDAEQLWGEKRVVRSIPWRPEWQRSATNGVRPGPADAGAGPTPPAATVPPDARRRVPSFRSRLRAARPHHHHG